MVLWTGSRWYRRVVITDDEYRSIIQNTTVKSKNTLSQEGCCMGSNQTFGYYQDLYSLQQYLVIHL
jgi:hypothetical protein